MTQVWLSDVAVEEITSEVRRLTAQSFDVARAYACGGDVRPLARRAASLDADLARLAATIRVLPGDAPQEIAGRCDTARQALTHLLAAPRMLRIRL